MRIERTKNAARNIYFGILNRIYSIVVPFLLRTAMIYFMGIQYLGLNSLFASILSVLNLAELGVGSAMVYSMYKPIAEDDTKTICALMRLYRTYYRIIGFVIGAIGILLTPFVPKLIKGTIPGELNIYVLYLLNLGATVLSYWLFAYRNCLFNAHQRGDMTTKITMVSETIRYLMQFFVIICLKNYYIYIMTSIVTQVISNIMIAISTKKVYPLYKPQGSLENSEVKKINRRVVDLFTSKIGAVVVNSADTIVISAFLGISVLAIYQNYFFIMTAVIGVVEIIFSACMAGIGNSIIVEKEEKNFYDLKKLTFMICWIAGFCMCCFLCLYQPFMELWVGKNLMLGIGEVVCLSLYFYIYEVNRLLNTYKDAAGIWHEDRFRPLVTALSNLVMNLIMVKPFGIYGVILSTVLSILFVGMPWLLYNLFSILFAPDLLGDYLQHLIEYFAAALLACVASYFVGTLFKGTVLLTLIIRGFICLVIPNLLFYIFFRKRNEFDQLLKLVEALIHRKIRIREK